jgi:CDP-paratose 2-epimerase
MKILITGGAGFVGSTIAKNYRTKYPNAEILIFDNLKRRGSEMNLSIFKKLNIKFVHGDLRSQNDLNELNQKFDLMIDASAEASVQSGLNESAKYLLDTNLNGTINCLEFAKHNAGIFIFLSTSRVYSIKDLNEISLTTEGNRFKAKNDLCINENFSTTNARSLYGASKLCSEQLIQEYSYAYKMKTIINRCGVLVGAGQWGKTDQGVFSLWLVNHYFNKKLSYNGFGGLGLQVRDLLHPDDLFNLIESQIQNYHLVESSPYNVGGGLSNSVSLKELTNLCEKITSNKLNIMGIPETHIMDVPYYVTDNSLVKSKFNFRVTKNIDDIYKEIYQWIKDNESQLKEFFV